MGSLQFYSKRRLGLGKKVWGWRLRHDNGNIVAGDMHQQYENLEDCRKVALSVIGGDYKDADISYLDY